MRAVAFVVFLVGILAQRNGQGTMSTNMRGMSTMNTDTADMMRTMSTNTGLPPRTMSTDTGVSMPPMTMSTDTGAMTMFTDTGVPPMTMSTDTGMPTMSTDSYTGMLTMDTDTGMPTMSTDSYTGMLTMDTDTANFYDGDGQSYYGYDASDTKNLKDSEDGDDQDNAVNIALPVATEGAATTTVAAPAQLPAGVPAKGSVLPNDWVAGSKIGLNQQNAPIGAAGINARPWGGVSTYGAWGAAPYTRGPGAQFRGAPLAGFGARSAPLASPFIGAFANYGAPVRNVAAPMRTVAAPVRAAPMTTVAAPMRTVAAPVRAAVPTRAMPFQAPMRTSVSAPRSYGAPVFGARAAYGLPSTTTFGAFGNPIRAAAPVRSAVPFRGAVPFQTMRGAAPTRSSIFSRPSVAVPVRG